MAWGSVGTIGSSQSKAGNQTSLSMTLSAQADANNVVVVLVAKDNINTVDGNNTEVTSVTDSTGANTWNRILGWTNGEGGSQAGAHIEAYYSKISSNIAIGGTITANFAGPSSANDATAMTAWEFTIGAGNIPQIDLGAQALSTDAADPGSLTLSLLPNAEHLFLHGLSAEGPNTDAYTWDADYTQFTGNGTTGNPGGSNIHVRGGWRIFTGTTDTVDVTSTTADRDYAQIYFVLDEVTPPSSTWPGYYNAGWW